MGHKEDKKRSKGIILFRGLAIFQFVLGILMLVTAGLATDNSNGDHGYTDYGVPYYIGGFIVGFLLLGSAGLCGFVGIQGAKMESGDKDKWVSRAVLANLVLTLPTFVFCFIGLILAAVAECNPSTGEICNPRKADLRYALLAGCMLAVLSGVFCIYLSYAYGKYFGLVLKVTKDWRKVVKIDTAE